MSDLISRADAIEAVRKDYEDAINIGDNGDAIAYDVERILSALPSANYITEKPNDAIKPSNDVISRADAIEEISKGVWNVYELIDRINTLPSARVAKWEDYIGVINNCHNYAKENEALKKLLADRPQGEWIYDHHNDEHTCSVCGRKALYDDHVGIDWQMEVLSDYCPNCGAYMGGKE